MSRSRTVLTAPPGGRDDDTDGVEEDDRGERGQQGVQT